MKCGCYCTVYINKNFEFYQNSLPQNRVLKCARAIITRVHALLHSCEMSQRNLPLFQVFGTLQNQGRSEGFYYEFNLLCKFYIVEYLQIFSHSTHCEPFLHCVQQRKQKKYRRHRTTSTTTTELDPEVGDDVPEAGDGEKDMYSMLENDEEAEEEKKKKKVIVEEEEEQEAKDEPPKETFKGNEIPLHGMSVLCPLHVTLKYSQTLTSLS